MQAPARREQPVARAPCRCRPCRPGSIGGQDVPAGRGYPAGPSADTSLTRVTLRGRPRRCPESARSNSGRPQVAIRSGGRNGHLRAGQQGGPASSRVTKIFGWPRVRVKISEAYVDPHLPSYVVPEGPCSTSKAAFNRETRALPARPAADIVEKALADADAAPGQLANLGHALFPDPGQVPLEMAGQVPGIERRADRDQPPLTPPICAAALMHTPPRLKRMKPSQQRTAPCPISP